MTALVEIGENSQLEAIAVKVMLEKIAKNFDRQSLSKIAELSEIPKANEKIKNLFSNPLFKMALK